MKFRYFTFILLFWTFSPCLAQIQFAEQTSVFNAETSSGLPMAICDMNNDNLDDVIRLDEKKFLVIDYQNTDGSFERKEFGEISGEAWSMCVGDVDNDGQNEITVGGFYDGLKLLIYDANADNYLRQSIPGFMFIQGSNLIDMDLDGDLDFFACDDDSYSKPYRNQGAYSFEEDLSLINTFSGNSQDDSGNYGSTWVDYDNDNDLDLYLSKCRLNVFDPLDPRRVNLLYRNDGKDGYNEVAEESLIRPLGQSWTTDFADLDNDGDMDAFVINHDIPSSLYINEGNGTFQLVNNNPIDTNSLNLLKNIYQSKFIDFDNDGLQDLILTASEGIPQIYKNNGGFDFELVAMPFEEVHQASSFTSGDLNNDGFVDLLFSYSRFVNGDSSEPDNLFLNEGNSNNYIKVKLTGTNSNINGIGSRIEIYTNQGKQIRDVRSGESYGTMHSLIAHFGIGNSTIIDSINVIWPTGKNQSIKNVNPNETVEIIENFNCVTQYTMLGFLICENDSIEFGGQFISEDGVYNDTLQTNLGCDSIIELNLNTFFERIFDRDLYVCDNNTIVINGMPVTENGIYYDTFPDMHLCDSIIASNVTFLNTYENEIDIDLCEGDTILLGGMFITGDAEIIEELSTINGCDSTNIYKVELIEQVYDTISTLLCDSEIIFINGTMVSEAGMYNDTITSQDCDLINVYDVTVESFEVIIESDYNAIFNPIEYMDYVYQWIDCDAGSIFIVGETNPIYFPESSGSYALAMVNIETGCTFWSECLDFIISSNSSIDQQLMITPNPSSDYIQIESTEEISDVKLIGLDGKSHELNQIGSNRFDVSVFPVGYYFIQMELGDELINLPLVLY